MKKINKPLKLGFVGGGIKSAIGQTHFSASQLDGKWKVVSGIFSENKKINKKTANMWNISRDRVYDNLKNFNDLFIFFRFCFLLLSFFSSFFRRRSF